MAAKKQVSAKGKRYECYEVKGDTAVLQKRHCPRCGPGVLMAAHKDRVACGKCGYTEFQK
ncbi:30S ribosomal protein S27ae [Methanoculleus chikugoensis]|jgi:small subunit ribosomal protein S27Ae|uniref:Small ribosomal subunit protein eS31 n=1 Tax=Methanoculleus chikugoensis TaxID=118126 RepID=A0A1M4MM71_9EURY|nr:30S ribosomal protein S27ae [Methanoculleus chikugoensis]MDD4567566.1 30S ribosomal protein S27ae [Methanoculleus chikugoensis]NMA11348.1 30S ribosomal protein S27ae [Methanomicrobiales archaeon]BBL69384.1 30S ribosomal protein S27ae [Methanoculleus chikugoensis]SCL75942.1 30S ribosomal protein S27ae [Methanoculleus chikugoensis]